MTVVAAEAAGGAAAAGGGGAAAGQSAAGGVGGQAAGGGLATAARKPAAGPRGKKGAAGAAGSSGTPGKPGKSGSSSMFDKAGNVEQAVDSGINEARGLTLTPPKRLTVNDGAGFLGGLLLYILALNYLRYGREGVKGWLGAKFVNRPWTPPDDGGADGGSDSGGSDGGTAGA